MTKTSQAYTRTTKAAEAPPLPSRLVRLLYEARWLAMATLLAYLAIILLTYSRNDPGWSVANTVPHLHNWGGRIGAWLADLMLYIFGMSAWWWCVLLAHSIWRSYRKLANRFLVQTQAEPEHHQEGLIRAIGFVFLLAGSLGIEYMRMYSMKAPMPRAPGGVLGEMIGSAAQSSLGFTGATLLLLLLFGLGFSLFFHVSWLAAVERIGGAIEDGIFWVRNFYSAREDRKVGHVAAVKREEVVVQERAKIVEKHVAAPPVKIEPQVVTVVKSERVEKERQATLFENLGDGKLPPLSLLDEAPPVVETV